MIPRSCTRRRPRLVTAVFAFMIVVMGGATTVSAHGGESVGDVASVNYVTRITDAGAPELGWRVDIADSSVELTNNTGTDVVVLGYQSEPYLKFTPGEGVQRNTSSPATYLNEDRLGDVEIPFGVSADDEPVWETVSDTNQFSWRARARARASGTMRLLNCLSSAHIR